MGAVFIAPFSPISSSSAAPSLVTCINLQTGTERISHTGSCRYTQEAQANWRKNSIDSAIASGPSAKVITICSNKESSPVSYQVIRAICAKHQVTTIFSRSGTLPAKPVIAEAVSFDYNSASLKLAADPATNADAPIAFYTITSSTVDTRTPIVTQSQRVYYWKDLSIAISGLRASTRYTFTLSATTADGTSPVSISTIPVTTPAYVPPASTSTSSAPILAAPAFSLSADAETKTVNTAITGYTISSTGGAVASFAISPAAPAGTTFSTSTGLLTGTPTATQSATAYTITATNASGTATRTFTLTVTSVVYTVGQPGPGGGIIFYVASSPFACGPTRSATCTYLEAAPSLWNAGAVEPTRSWAQTSPVDYSSTSVNNSSSPETATATAIGWGYRNTRAIILQGNTDTATSAAALADSYTVTVSGVAYDDWYLPSKDELNQMCKWQRGVTGADLTTLTTGCTGGTLNSGTGAAGFVASWYLSSSETYTYTVLVQSFASGGTSNGGFKDSFVNYVRPMRAF